MRYIKSFEQNVKDDEQRILLEIFESITKFDIDKFKSLIDKINIETSYINPKDSNEHESIIHKICECAISFHIYNVVDTVKSKGLKVVKKNILEMLDIALSKNCNLNISCGIGWHNGYPLELLFRTHSKDIYDSNYFRNIVLKLLENGSDPNKFIQDSPLIKTIEENNYETFKILMENGADPNTCEVSKSALSTIVSTFCNKNFEDFLKFMNLLLKYKVNLNIRPIDIYPNRKDLQHAYATALMTSSDSPGRNDKYIVDIFNYLIDNGADISIKNKYEQTVLDIAGGKVRRLIKTFDFQDKIIKMNIDNLFLLSDNIINPEIKEKYEHILQSKKYNI